MPLVKILALTSVHPLSTPQAEAAPSVVPQVRPPNVVAVQCLPGPPSLTPVPQPYPGSSWMTSPANYAPKPTRWLAEGSTPAINSPEQSTPDIRPPGISPPEISSPKIGSPKILPRRMHPPKLSSPDISSPEKRSAQINFGDTSSPERGSMATSSLQNLQMRRKAEGSFNGPSAFLEGPFNGYEGKLTERSATLREMTLAKTRMQSYLFTAYSEIEGRTTHFLS